MRKIHICYINKIKRLQREIYEVEDDDYVDRRIVANKQRAINNTLKKAGINDPILQEEIFNNVSWYCDNCVERLEKIGWTILKGKENL